MGFQNFSQQLDGPLTFEAFSVYHREDNFLSKELVKAIPIEIRQLSHGDNSILVLALSLQENYKTSQKSQVAEMSPKKSARSLHKRLQNVFTKVCKKSSQTYTRRLHKSL